MYPAVRFSTLVMGRAVAGSEVIMEVAATNRPILESQFTILKKPWHKVLSSKYNIIQRIEWDRKFFLPERSKESKSVEKGSGLLVVTSSLQYLQCSVDDESQETGKPRRGELPC